MTGTRAAIAAAGTVSIAVTAAVALLPLHALAYRNGELHIALQTAEVLIGLLAAYLVLGRLRRRERLDDLLLCLALTVLALSNLLFAAAPDMLASTETVFSTWSALSGRTVGAALLLAAAVMPSRRLARSTPHAGLVVASSFLALGAIALVVGALEAQLPAGVAATAGPQGSSAPDLDVHPVVLAAQLLSLGLYAGAAVGFARGGRRRADPLLTLLGVGCVFAAAARANYALYPSVFTDFVYVGDLFRLAFYVLVLAGALREIRSYWESVAGVAALDERRRIARDLHDGLAQELASIGRNLAWLEDGNQFVERARASAARGLNESRRAISALSGPWEGSVDVALGETVCQVGEREGVEVLVELDHDIRLGPAQREALTMIAAEAVTNAARHGGAEQVRVALTGGRKVRLAVQDAGRGFDPGTVGPSHGSGFGLTSMRDRAGAVGARLHVDSRPGEGTQVEVVL